jgi:hypothetical protein
MAAHSKEGDRGAKAKNDPPRKAKVLGIGPDGRKIYTKDRGARAGKRSATNRRPGGLYVGRELQIAVAVRAILNTDTTHGGCISRSQCPRSSCSRWLRLPGLIDPRR